MKKLTREEKEEIRSIAIDNWENNDDQKYNVFMFKGEYYIISTKADNNTFIVRDLEDNIVHGLFY